jgi:hypothetical protein
MGQAKRRNAEVQKWQASLSPEEKAVADTAQRLLQRFIDPSEATGMCYRQTFFGIQTTPVVGYVNDGTTFLSLTLGSITQAKNRTSRWVERNARI